MRFLGLLAFLAGCGVTPCDQYVQYMCDCHPEVDCEELRATYFGASSDVQDQCAIAHDEQEAADNGECPVNDTDA